MKQYNLGTVKVNMSQNGFPKGLILKRDLNLNEAKHILKKLLGIELQTLKDCYDKEEYNDINQEYLDTVNGWLKGEMEDDYIISFAFDCSDEQLGLMNMIPILAYLKQKEIID